MNALVKFDQGGELAVNPDDLLTGLGNMTTTARVAAGNQLPYLKLQKDGIWAYGKENQEVEEDSRWAINPAAMAHGWACWGDKQHDNEGEQLGEQMVPFTQPLPPRATLQEYGPPWKPQTALILQCVSGEDEGVTVMYKGTSKGQQDAVGKITDAIRARIQSGEKAFVPVVTLDSSWYTHKKHGKTYTPDISIVGWLTMDGGSESPSEAATPSAGEDDASAGQTAQAPPRRRRRRKAADENA